MHEGGSVLYSLAFASRNKGSIWLMKTNVIKVSSKLQNHVQKKESIHHPKLSCRLYIEVFPCFAVLPHSKKRTVFVPCIALYVM